MSFRFKIEDVAEVYKDPMGHYHHWTILIGKLVEGTIRVADYIKIPLADGTTLASQVGGFSMANQDLGHEVAAGQYENAFGLMIWRPARSDDVLRDVAHNCTPEEFHTLLLDTLQHQPIRIFHHRGSQAPDYDCHECVVLPNTPEVVTILRNLQTLPDTYIAHRALQMLNVWG